MEYKLKNLYDNVKQNTPYASKPDLPSLYKKGLNEDAGYNFDRIATHRNLVPWTSFESSVYNKIANKGSGRGEFSIASVLLRSSGVSEEEIVKAVTNNTLMVPGGTVSVLVQGGAKNYDVFNPITGEKYEVKESTGESVLVGTKARAAATNLLERIDAALTEITKAYSKLTSEQKQIIDELAPTSEEYEKYGYKGLKAYGYTGLEALLDSASVYITGNRDKLTRGTVMPIKQSRKGTPKLFLIPVFIKKITDSVNLITEETLKAKDRIDLIQDIYNTDRAKAKTIDIKAKNIIAGKEADTPEEAFDDFIFIAQNNSIFSSPEVYNSQITAIFTSNPGETAKAILQKIFPNTGIFVVTTQGWAYAGFENINKLIKITEISFSSFKIAPHWQSSDESSES